ncbi:MULTISPECIES: LysR substrate-binding domain-containing protein [Sphingosinicella]|jgi:LysR family transcriptional regulator, glycine cleavage system transcriptional activator|uniref:LysR family transcriptional regulator n=1 Tax=Sphingosinicella microcystinivorans TaxID=335406 RepID=A0AAD1D5S5_SPHMI|nr:LysR substrate-binding domain-containing protein [Sphingosinicella microcystinivorans]RKS91058.1 LysR family transcriptional regulator [Sphingosinicella microcystinivorans]BBE33979.1 transcriptional regulator GcvA [Sphingosinicella microcystinivorans]
MTRRLPSVNALKCFEVAAAQMSIRKAASVLRVSESAVSRQVRILEQQLSVTLFHRGHNGLELTPEGKILASSTKDAFDQIARTIDSFHRDQDVVELRVLPTFALRWLYPRLREFQEQYPFVKVMIHTRWHDMISSDNDAELGIRYGLGNWRNEDVTELYAEQLVPICAPGYISGGELRSAEDLRGKTLLHSQPDHQDWKTWAAGWNGGVIDTDNGLDFDVLDMALRAAEAGFGITASDLLLAHDAIRDEQLIMASRRVVASGTSYYLVRPANLNARRQVRLLSEWICDEMSSARQMLAAYRN